jgi:Rod binding domain-containing protein
MFGNMPGAEIYQDMFTQAVSDSVSKTGTFGIAKSLVTQLSKDVMQAELAKQQLTARKAKIDIAG